MRNIVWKGDWPKQLSPLSEQELYVPDHRTSSLTPGSAVPAFEVSTLDGETTQWEPAAETDRLLVFCSLWHPESKAFFEKACKWADENKTPIELISLDWNLDQTRREVESLNVSSRTLFAGLGQLKLDEQWGLSGSQGAFLITRDGKLKDQPLH